MRIATKFGSTAGIGGVVEWTLPLLVTVLLLATPTMAATTSPWAIVPVLVAPQTPGEKFAAIKSNLLDRMSDIPPVEVGVSMDFEITRTPTTAAKGKKAAKNPVDTKPTMSSSITAAEPLAAPPTKTVVTQKPTTQTSLSFLDRTKQGLVVVKHKINQHKYASVVWASLFIVWIPLLAVVAIYQIEGKEALVELLVNLLPASISSNWIEHAVDEGVWVPIYAASIIATLGAFLVETSLLLKEILASPPAKTKTGWIRS